MCYHVSVSIRGGVLEKRFRAAMDRQASFKPVYHAAAFSLPCIPVITSDQPKKIQMFRWGLIPFWAKDEETARKLRMRTFNARSENIHDKPVYRHPIKSKRCMVLVDGFFEWQEVQKARYPYYICFADRKPFALGGIWDSWTNRRTGEISHTFSIITTRGNALLRRIHNTTRRMPVILKPEQERRWLDTGLPENEVDKLMEPYEEKRLSAYPISRLITARDRNSNVPSVLKEFHYTELEVKTGAA